jgi:hypothetical protein
MPTPQPQPMQQSGSVPVPDPTTLTTKALEKDIAALKELLSDRIESLRENIETRLSGNDKAIAATLEAQKEAVGKSEQSVAKQIDAISTLIRSESSATDSKIGDIKDRLTAIEAGKKGATSLWGGIAAAIGALVGVAGIIIAVVVAMNTGAPAP